MEQVARGLKILKKQTMNDVRYSSVDWRRVDKYIQEFGYPYKWGSDLLITRGNRPDFIPEGIFHRMAMKIKNPEAEKFRVWVADEVIPNISERQTDGTPTETPADETPDEASEENPAPLVADEFQIFTNPAFGKVRAMTIEGEPWFVGRDVASVLGYAKPENAIAAHVDSEDKTTTLIQGTGSNYKSNAVIINESGLYSLVMSSKLPDAKKFKRWVTSEVLPAIRKTGGYIHGAKDMTDLEIVSAALLISQRTIEERDATIKRLEADNDAMTKRIAAFEPVRNYVDQILSSHETLTTTQIAADYGLSARKLNEILHEERIQHKVNGQWILYKKHMENGYTQSVTVNITHKDGTSDTKMHTQWTQKGRLMIHGILTRRGIHANVDLSDAKPA